MSRKKKRKNFFFFTKAAAAEAAASHPSVAHSVKAALLGNSISRCASHCTQTPKFAVTEYLYLGWHQVLLPRKRYTAPKDFAIA